MLLMHAAREKRRQQLVALDAIVERVDQAPDRLLASRPLKKRLHSFSPSSSLNSYRQARSTWAEQNGETGIPLTSRLSILLAKISIGHDSLRFVAPVGCSDTAR
jgi:hypothetical protein